MEMGYLVLGDGAEAPVPERTFVGAASSTGERSVEQGGTSGAAASIRRPQVTLANSKDAGFSPCSLPCQGIFLEGRPQLSGLKNAYAASELKLFPVRLFPGDEKGAASNIFVTTRGVAALPVSSQHRKKSIEKESMSSDSYQKASGNSGEGQLTPL